MSVLEERESRYGQPWNRDELNLAFDLYCRIPFQQTKMGNPKVQELALLIGRTPASVARKLGNFGAFDPGLQRKGISGLIHAGKLDKEIWDEFHQDWNALVIEAVRLRRSLSTKQKDLHELHRHGGPSELLRETKVRIHQPMLSVFDTYSLQFCLHNLLFLCIISSIQVVVKLHPTSGGNHGQEKVQESSCREQS